MWSSFKSPCIAQFNFHDHSPYTFGTYRDAQPFNHKKPVSDTVLLAHDIQAKRGFWGLMKHFVPALWPLYLDWYKYPCIWSDSLPQKNYRRRIIAIKLYPAGCRRLILDEPGVTDLLLLQIMQARELEKIAGTWVCHCPMYMWRVDWSRCSQTILW